jgi:hypothetical protein
MNDMSNHLTDKQYKEVMERLAGVVKSGSIKLNGFDSDAVGDRDTQCTWGLCGENPFVYHSADMHLFPEQLPGRLSPKYKEKHHRCPFEDPLARNQTSGCFYRCRFFQQNKRPSKVEWEVWYKLALEWSAKR